MAATPPRGQDEDQSHEFTRSWLSSAPAGFCKVDETPKGWYIQYIDRDPETIRRQEELARKKKHDLDDEERSAKFIEEQVRRGRDGKEIEENPVYTELKRESEEEKVAFNLGASLCVAGPSKTSSALGVSALKKDVAVSAKRKDTSSDTRSEKKRKSALEEIIEMEERKKKKQQPVRTDYWLQPNIVVKVVTKKLGERYHKRKAVIMEVKDKYSAVVKMIDSGDKLKLDQTHLETVIPAPGKQVLILNGPYRDTEALLEGIDEKSFTATLTLDSVSLQAGLLWGDAVICAFLDTGVNKASPSLLQGQQKGKRVDVAYEDFSKLA